MIDLIRRMMERFAGNSKKFVTWHPSKGYAAVDGLPTEKHFQRHLDGSLGVAISPILLDSTCRFGAIDIDDHDGPGVSIPDLEARVRGFNLPLAVCRSKRGGGHLYLFLRDQQPASKIRAILTSWARRLDYPKWEIFPKQSAWEDTMKSGSTINLPYFDLANTGRYGFKDGKPQSLEEFLDEADRLESEPLWGDRDPMRDYPEAPPCLQTLMKNGIGSGIRNEALYNFAVFARRAFGDKAADESQRFNITYVDPPLPDNEFLPTIRSAGRKNCRYKCHSDLLSPVCEASLCITRKFGITPSEKTKVEGQRVAMSRFARLERMTTDPVQWTLYYDDQPIRTSTRGLYDWSLFRLAALEQRSLLLPALKNELWHANLTRLLRDISVEEAPEEISPGGQVEVKLNEFIRRADLKSDGQDIAERDFLLRGLPVLQEREKVLVVYFRGVDFIEFLKRNRSEDLKGADLWDALKKVGVEHCRLRVGSTIIPVWYVAAPDHEPIPVREFKTEF